MRQIKSKSLDEAIELIRAADRLDIEWTAERRNRTTKLDDGSDDGSDVEVAEYSLELHGIW